MWCRLFSKQFCLQPFSPEYSVVLLFAWLNGSVGWSQGRHQWDNFWNLGLLIAGKCIFLELFLEFYRVSCGVLMKSWLESYMQLSFMHVCKYLNQKSKKKEKTKQMKKLSFIPQFTIDFLLQFTDCRNVLWKTPMVVLLTGSNSMHKNLLL